MRDNLSEVPFGRCIDHAHADFDFAEDRRDVTPVLPRSSGFKLTRKTNSADFLTDPCGVIYARIRLRWFAPLAHIRSEKRASLDRKSRAGKARSRAAYAMEGV